MQYNDLLEILAEQFGCEPEELTEDTDLYEDLGADELDATELAWNVGEGIGREVPEEDIAACRTVGDVWRYIRRITPADPPANPVTSRTPGRDCCLRCGIFVSQLV